MSSLKLNKKNKQISTSKVKEKYLIGSRLEMCSWLENNAPVLCELYKGALFFLYDPVKVPGWQNYVCYSVREIANRLPDAIQGQEGPGRFDYKGHAGKIAELWKENGFPLTEQVSQASSGNSEINISKPLFESIRNFLFEHEKVAEKRSDRAKILFDSYESSFGSISIPIANSWITITGWFSDNVHVNALGKKTAPIDTKILEQFLIFEAILGSIIKSFFSTLGELDEILEKTNN